MKKTEEKVIDLVKETELKPETLKESSKPIKSSQINKGDMVKIVGAMYANGEYIPSLVKERTHKISKMKDNKVLLGEDGGINSWIYLKDISK